MTLIISSPITNFIAQPVVLTDVDAIIKWAIQTRSDAHGNDELQAELNDILNKAYEEKWRKKKQ